MKNGYGDSHRNGTGRRQPPWRNVSKMSKTSKQWSHPGSASVAQQVPVVPPERGMSRSDKGLKRRSPFTRRNAKARSMLL